MYEIVANGVFPWLRQLGGDGSTYSQHMKDARFTIPTPNLLVKAVDDILDELPLEHGDVKGGRPVRVHGAQRKDSHGRSRTGSSARPGTSSSSWSR